MFAFAILGLSRFHPPEWFLTLIFTNGLNWDFFLLEKIMRVEWKIYVHSRFSKSGKRTPLYSRCCMKGTLPKFLIFNSSKWWLLNMIKTCLGSQFSSVALSCLTLCDLMDLSTPGFPVPHHLLEFAQTHAHWVTDKPSSPLSPPSLPSLNLSQH